MFTRTMVFALGGVFALSSALADDQNKDSGLPAPVTLDQFGELFEKSPFRRHLSLSESLILSGVATLPTGNVVTVLNRSTNETFVVSKEPNVQGWKLIELLNDNDLTRVSAKIAAGGQVVTVRFDPKRLAPEGIDASAKPGSKTVENTVVEALLKNIDPESATTFELLKPKQQEKFRTTLARFLNTYPESSDQQKIEFVRTTLSTMQEPGVKTGTEGKNGSRDEGNGKANPENPEAPE